MKPPHKLEGHLLMAHQTEHLNRMNTPAPLDFQKKHPLPEAGSTTTEVADGRASLDSFHSSIQSLVRSAELKSPTEYLISFLLTEFCFQKRRIYDVMSVLSAIGCCQKISVESVFWAGLSKVPATLLNLQWDAGADVPTAPLEQIVQAQNDVSISPLTVGFLLCFLALRQATFNIRQISRYLCRKTGRLKSAQCKLYQIAHILEAAGVIQWLAAPDN
jgi:hypothetical protein